MNILFLALDVDLTTQRGDAVHVAELARFLARRGNQVHLITATRYPSVPDLGPNVSHHQRPDGGDLGIVHAIVRIAGRSHAEIVYERRLSPKIAFAVSRLIGAPFVLEVNGSEEELTLQGRRTSPLSGTKRWMRTRMYRKAARIVAVTEPLAAEIRTRYKLSPERVAVVPNGVDPDRFAPMDREEARRRSVLVEGPLIVFVGNLAPWQGVDVLLRAMPAVLARHPTAKVAVVGQGERRIALEDLTQELGLGDSVAFLGQVPHEHVPLVIGASTVGVVTSTRRMNERIGRSPLKAYEYLACARPIVASDVPGIAELVAASGGGIAVPPDDPVAFADALVRLLANPEEARAMGDRGRRYVAEECSWARTAERVERVLWGAVGES